ncbi:hypothetical protein [Burkholderia cepacia]|uniref:hypothetical protein n=1 Tax=Burkholderia cepacia TaxID=292 RepID=UPI002652FA92|nr:hypothetical protein [Burkholderia cepacia]MDN7611246.1 hypothetical protein [Burkholderia cepacia]
MSHVISLPELRLDQALLVADPWPWKVIRCGRRYGKTVTLESIAADSATNGEPVGIYAPKFDTLTETFQRLKVMLEPIITHSNAGHTIRTNTGGIIDFWSLADPNGLFGRGRKYKRVLIDEAAFAPAHTKHQYSTAIKYTTLEFPDAQTLVFSTPDVQDTSNFFAALHFDDEYRYDPTKSDEENYGKFKVFWRPTHSNPLIPRIALEKEKTTTHPLKYRQEVLAEFVDFSGESMFSNINESVDPHPRYDYIIATMDTALKADAAGQKGHDGSAVVFFGYSTTFFPHLHILDWDVQSIDGMNQFDWLKEILGHGEYLAKHYGAHFGFTKTIVEDKSSGIVLLQQARQAGLPAEAADSRITAIGKDGRMRLCIDPVYRNEVKFIHAAYNKTVEFHGVTKNHALDQILKFRFADKASDKREDDVMDAIAYGIIEALVPEFTAT